MKKMLKAAAIVLLALAAALGCNKEVEKTEAPPKASQVKQLVLVNLGSYWDWYAVPPDPGVFWEYPRLEKVKTIDVTDWEPGEDAVELGGSSSQWRDARDKFYYPWQGEDTIHYFITGPYLWVNGKRVGANLFEVYWGDIPDPKDIVTVVAGPAGILQFKHLPNLEVAHVIIFSGWIDVLTLLRGCLEQPEYWQEYFNAYWGWIALHFIGDKPKLYLTSKSMNDIPLVIEEPSNYDMWRFTMLKNIRGLDIGSPRLTSFGLSQLSRFKDVRVLRLNVWNVKSSFEMLESLPELRELCIRAPNANEGMLENLEGIVNLRSLELGYLKVNDESLRRIAGFKNLRKLKLYWSQDSLSADGWLSIAKAGRLESLSLEDVVVQKSELEAIGKINSLKSLELRSVDVGVNELIYLKYFEDIGELEELTLILCSLRDLGLEGFKGFEKLKWLDLSYNGVTDTGLMYLHVLKNLELLRLNGVDMVTSSGLEKLHSALPQCQIIWSYW